MTRIEVVTYDVETGCTMIDRVFRVARHYGTKHIAKIRRSAERWAEHEIEYDKSTTHAVLLREV